MLTLNSDISEIPKVGPAMAKRIKSLGLESVSDLLFYFPYRWEDFSQIIKVNQVRPHEICTIRGKVQLITGRRSFRRRRMFITESLVADDTGSIKVIWFNQPYLSKILKTGDEIILSGKVTMDYLTPEFTSPSFEKVKKEQTHTGRIVPVYSLTAGISQRQMRFFLKTVLPLAKNITDFLPAEIIRSNRLMPLSLALKQIHFPDRHEILSKAAQRLKFDELFLIQAQVLQNKMYLDKAKAPKVKFLESVSQEFVKSLPFKLTNSQKKTAWQILRDLEKPSPMNRLLSGDVGSGKTIVAVMAILNTVRNGFQAAYMAPTEILARQHFEKIRMFLKPFRVKTALLTRSFRESGGRKISKSDLMKKIKNGGVELIIGTHALIQEEVNFKNLALVIIDEQHRFGVAQRKSLREKFSTEHKLISHLLSMTATPIPRSLALTVYGDLDLSIISEMPAGRKKILTKVVNPEKRIKAYDFLRKQINDGRQIFVICPLIEPSDKLGVRSVKQEYEKLKNEIFADLKISLIHGKLKSAEKEKVMNDFKNNKINILVSTSVIEVGIDIPNATVMMIEGTERFGLAQLHQFRGRVGRSSHQSYCFLFTESDSPKTIERLAALERSNDGFYLAEFDLKTRGPGDFTGIRQSGLPDFRMASLSDVNLIAQTRAAAKALIENDPELNNYPLLKQKIGDWQKEMHGE
ncbi:MAG: ATP-dependent DNA helicase RecG [Patescibacteria group bacterium]